MYILITEFDNNYINYLINYGFDKKHDNLIATKLKKDYEVIYSIYRYNDIDINSSHMLKDYKKYFQEYPLFTQQEVLDMCRDEYNNLKHHLYSSDLEQRYQLFYVKTSPTLYGRFIKRSEVIMDPRYIINVYNFVTILPPFEKLFSTV